MKDFFTAEDFGRMHPVDLCGGIKEKMITTAEASQLANTKVAPLIAENERLKEQLLQRLPTFTIAHNSDTEMLRWERDVADKNARAALAEVKEIGMLLGAEANKNQKLTEQNRELESIISKRVPKLEKILSIMTEQNRILKEALEFYSGTVEKQVEIWDKSLLIDRGDKAREALAAVKKLGEK